jgi:hypothetical protein
MRSLTHALVCCIGQRMPTQQKVPVTRRALVQRIKRKLRDRDEMLVSTSRGAVASGDLGDFCVVGIHGYNISQARVDPEKLGRKLGVLQPWEQLVDE